MLVRTLVGSEGGACHGVRLRVTRPRRRHNSGDRLAVDGARESLIVVNVSGEDKVGRVPGSLGGVFDNRLQVLAAGMRPVCGVNGMVQGGDLRLAGGSVYSLHPLARNQLGSKIS